MKINVLFIAAVLFFSGCSSSKKAADNLLTSSTWQLDSIYLQEQNMDSLFPQKRPQLKFDAVSKTVSGNDGCNGYTAPYTLDGDSLSFGEPGPATLMYCGEGEQIFRNTMKNIRSYKIDKNGNLILLAEDSSGLLFRKSVP